MRQASSLLFVVLLVIVGAGWYFFQGSSSHLSAVGGVSPVMAGGAEEATSHSSPELDPAPDRPVAERTQVEAPSPAMSLEPTEVRTLGSKTDGPSVRGRVVDTAGNPLAGARIVVAGGDPLPLDFAGGSNSGYAKRWRTVSRADGTFELRGPSRAGSASASGWPSSLR